MLGVTRSCGDRARKAAAVSLPVLGSPTHPTPRKSKSGPRRAVVLSLVYVVMAIHVLLWLRYGMTVSPVEPSESMATLERGEVNAGFVFFVAAIGATLVFGRFFCGWGCHVVALQDLCNWGMKKVGVRPKPFRTRLLVLAPLALALYMFVWPTFHREALTPGLKALGTGVPVWLGQSGPRPELHNAFMVEDFWETFPPWYVAAPFLLVCGFGAVYFLGAKGFCTYGCPYGGFFGPADMIAPGRILVNDNCEQCGHCTAACTSNVRVHEEVRDFGMVVDPGCMKCMDCVSVCPNHALRFGFALPPVLNAKVKKAKSRPARHYDVSLRGEVVLAVVGLVLFIGYRGMFDVVPMLMAVGIAGIGAFGAWKLGLLFTTPNVRIQSLQLRLKGRMRPVAWMFVPLAVLVLAAGAWGAVVQYHIRRGLVHDAKVTVPAHVYLSPGFRPDDRMAAAAGAAIESLERADSPGHGGIGWSLRPDLVLSLASLHAVLGELVEAEALFDRAAAERAPTDEMLQYRAAIVRRAESEAALLVRQGAEMVGAGKMKEALAAYRRAAEVRPRSGVLRVQYGVALVADGRTEAGLAAIDEGINLEPLNPDLWRSKAEILSSMGRETEAEACRMRAEGLS